MVEVAYRTADVDGFTVFYREAGASDAPTLILLHGFPSASHQFRELIPLLADRFHLVAPDLPGYVNYAIKGEYLNDFLGQFPEIKINSAGSGSSDRVVQSTQQSVAIVLVY